ncbi:MAG: hypothetical protein PHI12_11330 [Dehalococcoidales bacterium]|nr:hypothetical protein [Dehalococcoidales bacterium]
MLEKIINFILAIFGIKPILRLTHPEEDIAPYQTAANTDAAAIRLKWLVDWKVPKENWDIFIGNVQVVVFDYWTPEIFAKFPTFSGKAPAFTFAENGQRYIYILAPWLNAGIFAHENGHTSWFMLTEDQKRGFSEAYDKVKKDPLIVYLFDKKPYGNPDDEKDIEDHADIYRFLAEKMPAPLKPFYPLLF